MLDDLEVIVIEQDGKIEGELAPNELTLEIDLSVAVGSSTIADVVLIEVDLSPGYVAGQDIVRNAGNAPGLMVLEVLDPVPPGTPAGTVILRKS